MASLKPAWAVPEPAASGLKLIVIEPHALVRDLLVLVCGQAGGVTAIGAKDAAEGVELCRAEQPDLVLLDSALPDGDGLERVPAILSACPGCKVIAISDYADEFTLNRVLRFPVHGFLDKSEQPLRMLGEAIHAVLAGRRYLSSAARRVEASLRNDPDAFDKLLSNWEQELLCLFGRGLSNEEIARRESLSALTVRNHRCRIMAKLGVHSTPELIHYAMDKGFTRLRPACPPAA